MAVTREQVAKLYVANFNRAPDAAGLDYWISDGTSATTELTDLNAIAKAMQAGAEASTGVSSMTDSEYVISLYSSMFGRTVAADSADVTYWTDALTAGNVTRANMIQTLIAGAEADTGSATDAAVLANKTTVGLYYADTLGLTGTDFSLSSVTDDTATVDTAKADADDLVPQTIALTAGADTVTGGSGDDTITGVYSSLSSEKTYDTTDTIDGGAGTDTFNLDLKGNAPALTTGSISNVENINLTNSTTIKRSFDAKNITGIETLGLDSTKGIDVSNLAATGIELDIANTQANFTVAFNADTDLTGTSDAMSLTVDGVGTEEDTSTTAVEQVSVKMTMASVEEITVTTQNNASVMDFSAIDATTITASGDQNLTITAVKDDLTTVDAGNLTGALTINTTGVTTAGSITDIASGSGNDTITADAADLVANVSISGGAGTDVLKLKDSAAAGSTTQFAMSGVETVRLTGVATGQTLTFSARDISDLSTIQLDANGTDDGAASIVNLGSSDVTLKTLGAIDANQDITMDNSGTTTVNMTVSSTDATAVAAGTGATLADSKEALQDITLSNSTNVTVNVGDYVEYKTATLSAAKATDLTLNVNSAKNAATTPTEQTAFAGVLEAVKATTVTIDADGTVNLLATSDLSAAQVVSITAGGSTNTSNADFEAAANVTLAGSATASAVTTGQIGTDGTTDVDYDLSIDASGLKAGLTTGNIATQEDLTINLASVTGNISLGGTIDATNATINATGIAGTFAITGATNATTAGTGTLDLNLANKSNTTNIAAMGTTTRFDTIDIDVSGALKDVTLGAIAADNVIINAENALKNVFVSTSADQTTADITVGESLTFTSGLKAADDAAAGADGVTVWTTTTATDVDITLNGNIGDDYFTILGKDTDDDTTITVTGDLDIGTNTLTIDASAADGTGTKDGKYTINLSGLEAAGTTTISVVGSANNDTITASTAGGTLTGGTGDDVFTASTGNDTFAYTDTTEVTANADQISKFGTSGTDYIALEDTKFQVGTSGAVTTAGSNTALQAQVFSGASITAYKSGVSSINAMQAGTFAVLFLDTSGTDAGLYYFKGSVKTAATASASAVYSSSSTFTIALTGATNQISATDIVIF